MTEEQLKDFKAKFPKTITVTEAMIREGRQDRWDCHKCIGYLALTSVVPSSPLIGTMCSWGVHSGHIRILQSLYTLYVQSFDANDKLISLMELTKPTTITFKLLYP